MVMAPALNSAQCNKLLTLLKDLLRLIEEGHLKDLHKKEIMTKSAATTTNLGTGSGEVSIESFTQLTKADAPNSFDVSAASKAAEQAKIKEDEALTARLQAQAESNFAAAAADATVRPL